MLTNREKNAIACGMNQNNNYKSNGKLFEQIFARKQRPQTDKYSTTANTLTHVNSDYGKLGSASTLLHTTSTRFSQVSLHAIDSARAHAHLLADIYFCFGTNLYKKLMDATFGRCFWIEMWRIESIIEIYSNSILHPDRGISKLWTNERKSRPVEISMKIYPKWFFSLISISSIYFWIKVLLRSVRMSINKLEKDPFLDSFHCVNLRLGSKLNF